MIVHVVSAALAIFIAIVAHEIAHGWVAYLLGDDTSKKAGRLSFNPLKHVDLFGTVIFPLILLMSKTGFIFGWAKPVPINFNKLKKYSRDVVFVSAAGIVMNILLAIFSALMLKLSLILPFLNGVLSVFWLQMILMNILLAVFNILPIPPLDGSKILLGWSHNPHIIKFLNAERAGLIFIILLIFIVPSVLKHFGLYLNPLADYLRYTTFWLANWLI